jgi:hypothetical protein
VSADRGGAGTSDVPEPEAPEPEAPDGDDPGRKRPILERLGLAAIALVLAGLFAGMAVAAFIGGEMFLAVMAGVACAMTLWVGGLTLVRG